MRAIGRHAGVRRRIESVFYVRVIAKVGADGKERRWCKVARFLVSGIKPQWQCPERLLLRYLCT